MEKKKILKNLSYVVISLVIIGVILGLGIYIGYSNQPEINKITSIINKNRKLRLLRTSVLFGKFGIF
jgi:hypothetical protein